MPLDSINNHQFYIRTTILQDQATIAAIQKAENLITQSKKPIKAYIQSRSISREAFNTFKKNITEEFSSATYHDLVELTVQSRETFFLVNLKDRLITILENSAPKEIISQEHST